MKYTDAQRIQKIRDYGQKLQTYIAENGVTKEALIESYALQWLVTTPLYNIGEQVYFLSEDIKTSRPDIPWAMISGLRHRLVHDYDGTNWNIIAAVVFDELPVLLEQLKEM